MVNQSRTAQTLTANVSVTAMDKVLSKWCAIAICGGQ
jgi:hypothetical protein